MERRAAAFARLFEAVHEGVYIGTLSSDGASTIAANPHLKLIFGYSSETSVSTATLSRRTLVPRI